MRHVPGPRGLRHAAGALAVSLTVVLLAGCTAMSGTGLGSPGADPGTGPPSSPAEPSVSASSASATTDTAVTLAVYGPPAELEAWRRVASRFDGGRVTLITARTHRQLKRRIAPGPAPDVFLTPRRELDRLIREDVTRPVGALLDARGVDFGDGFSRDALLAFGRNDHLQCLPWEISPLVVFVNTELVDLQRMRARGLPTPSSHFDWTWEQFAAVARAAARPARGIAGVHVPTTLGAIGAFLYAGGGKLYNSQDSPTSLAFSTEDSQEALSAVLPVLRDPGLTLSPAERAEQDALTRFQQGRLAMLVGDHSLVPGLRAAEGLRFDVYAIPRITEQATTGTVTGLCVASDSEGIAAAADLLVHLTSAESVSTVVRQGFTVPAKLSVLGSEVFTAPRRMPEHAGVFTAMLRQQEFGPVVGNRHALRQAVHPLLQRLVSIRVLDLGALTHLIDRRSQTVLGGTRSHPEQQTTGDAVDAAAPAQAGASPQP